MFLFKRKKIVLDCFTTNERAYTLAKIDYGGDFLPQWWRDLPRTIETGGAYLNGEPQRGSTIKGCRGFTRLYKNSIIIPFWENMLFETWGGDYKWTCTQTKKLIDIHPDALMAGFVDPKKFQHIKLLSPWRLKTNRFVEFQFSDPVWNRQNIVDYTILPGILDFKYNHGSHVNIMVNMKPEGSRFHIRVGEPVACLTPLTDDRVEIKNHLVSEKEICRQAPHPDEPLANKITKYKYWKEFLDNKEKLEEKSKCPFGYKK
jgi:hypothetical protein